MNYQTFHLRTVVASSAFLRIYPSWEFEEQIMKRLHHRTTTGGAMHSYTVGGQIQRLTIPLSHVNSSTRAAINSYWLSRQNVSLTMNVSESNAFTIVGRITNQEAPLGKRIKGREDLFFGNIFFQEIVTANGKIKGTPFILDDPVWGVLDGPGVLI